MKKLLLVLWLLSLTGCSTVSILSSSEKDSSYNCDYKYVNKSGGAYYKTDGPQELPNDINDIGEPIPKKEKISKWANRPYEVMGQKFVPRTYVGDYYKKGVGSWYGSRYHGKKTSSGEVYDMFKMTAASPDLPILSYARVTNLDNGRSVIVRVNDRGPFLGGRIIDLSFLAACRLNYVDKGTARVSVESIVP